MVTITKHEAQPSSNGDGYHRWRFWVLYDNQEIIIDCENGQYDYEHDFADGDDDEEIQIAIGEYMEEHNIDTGMIHR